MRQAALLRSPGPIVLGCRVVVLLIAAAPACARAQVPVGVAVEDITPDYPIRLMGYGSRKTESAGIASRLKARALAIGADQSADGGPAVLVAVDNCAVGANVTEEVATRLKNKVGLKRERFAVCSTHTHCAPALNSELDFIFGTPIPDDQKARIARYTRELTDAIEKVALAALAARSPASLSWGQGQVGFAANRRVLKDGRWINFGVNPNGPVDHSLPVLRAVDASGKVQAVLFGYACHCTTLGGEFNQICTSGPATPATRSSASFPARPRLRSSAAEQTRIPSRAVISTTPSSTDSPPRARSSASSSRPSHRCRPRSTPALASSTFHLSRLQTAPPSSGEPRFQVLKVSLPGVSSRASIAANLSKPAFLTRSKPGASAMISP